MRTGSIGNRDAESLVNTLVEPKKTIIRELRALLLSLGYQEEAGYDAINIESYISYSKSNLPRFILKHKWELAAFAIINDKEKHSILENYSDLKKRETGVNEGDGLVWIKLDMVEDKETIRALAERYF